MQEFTIGKNEAGQRFDKFLVKYLPNAPKSLLYKMLRKKNITLNNKKADGTEILSQNDLVKSFFSDETFEKFKGQAQITSNIQSLDNIQVVYEDDDIILLNKPCGVLSQKAKPNDYSINEWLIDYMLNNNKITREELNTFKPSIVNRLDRNTSGIILCGKSLSGIQFLTAIIREGNIEKHYKTICHGIFSEAKTVRGILIKDNKTNKVKVSSDTENANILTDFSPIEFFKNSTLLDVNLHTGKPHQIRAQLFSIGHPIYGDKKYFDSALTDNIDKKLKHQVLHCYKIVFPGTLSNYEKYNYLAGKTIEIEDSLLLKKVINEIG